MAASDMPRTRLEQLLLKRHMTIAEFRVEYGRATGESLSERQAYRWLGGGVKSSPYPRSQIGLELLFGESAGRLLGPAEDVTVPLVMASGSPSASDLATLVRNEEEDDPKKLVFNAYNSIPLGFEVSEISDGSIVDIVDSMKPPAPGARSTR